MASVIDLIESTGARVATVNAGEVDLSSASGRMTARVVGTVARHESEHKSERLRRKHLELFMGNPNNAREKLIDTSPAYQHEKLRVPVMLAHGIDDERVDYEQTLRMQRMLELDGRPAVGLVFEKEGHAIQDLDNLDTLWRGIAGFLQQNLGKAEASPPPAQPH